MRLPIFALAVAMLVMPFERSVAQDAVIDQVMTACNSDFEKYCSQVTPGEGRLLYCAAAHEDKLSGQCSYALYQAATVLERLAVALAYVANECEADIGKYCGTVKAGQGRILSCLNEKQAQVSAGCKKAVADTTGKM